VSFYCEFAAEHAKNYENSFAVQYVIAVIKRLTLLLDHGVLYGLSSAVIVVQSEN